MGPCTQDCVLVLRTVFLYSGLSGKVWEEARAPRSHPHPAQQGVQQVDGRSRMLLKMLAHFWQKTLKNV